MKEGYYVRRIPPKQTHEWILKKHYAHRIPSITFAFGLYDSQNILQGICTIGKPASPNLCEGVCGKEYSQDVFELNRLCVNEGLEFNVLSYFVSRSLSFLRTGFIIVSYADTGKQHHGYIYQATNWLYTGITKERTDIGGKEEAHSRHYDQSRDYNLNRKNRTAKHRYVIFVGRKQMKKTFREALKYPVLPYPKGDNQRYDASYKPAIQGVML